MKIQHLLAYLALSLIWGLSFLVVVNVVQAFGWVGAVTFRALVAGGVLFAISLASGRKLNFSVGWQPFAIVGGTTVAGQLVGLSVAAPRIGTAMTAVFVAAIPLFSMLIGQMWGIEKISRSGVAGLLLGLIGIVLLVGFPTIAINNIPNGVRVRMLIESQRSTFRNCAMRTTNFAVIFCPKCTTLEAKLAHQLKKYKHLFEEKIVLVQL